MKTSEWVSLGHPDKTADFISSYILDRYLEKDPDVRYALEVMIKDNSVILGGEITSIVDLSENYKRFVKEAIDEIGYTKEYNEKWGDNAICSDDVEVYTMISKQSPNIAQGVNNDGWGDQGIYFGYAENTYNYMPMDYNIAKTLGQFLYQQAKEKNIGGLDIKTQVSYEEVTETLEKVIVAIPVLTNDELQQVKDSVMKWLKDAGYDTEFTEIIINGTGDYKIHSSIGDCGITGRKLVVDFYGSGSRIGGGSPWTKDPSKADLSLNLYARCLAKSYLKALNNDYVHHVEVELNTCIGKPCFDITYKIFTEDYKLETIIKEGLIRPSTVVVSLDLKKPIYADLCKYGLFSKI